MSELAERRFILGYDRPRGPFLLVLSACEWRERCDMNGGTCLYLAGLPDGHHWIGLN